MREANMKLSIRVLKMKHCDVIFIRLVSIKSLYLAKKVAFSGRFGYNERRENARDENNAVCKVQESAIFKVQKPPSCNCDCKYLMTYTEG